MRQRRGPLSGIEILAQGRPGILGLRQAAPLQLRHHELDELADVVHRAIAAAQDEPTVRAGRDMQFLELVGDRLRRALRDQDAVDEKALAELLQRLLGIDGLEQFLEAAEIALLGLHLVGEIGEPHVRRRDREVDAVLRRHLDEARLGRDRVEVALLLRARGGRGFRDLHANRPENADVARLAAGRHKLGVELFPVLLHAGQRAACAELQFGEVRRERHAGT